MSVALRGNLVDFGIADVFQLIGQQRKTGVLELSARRRVIELRFDRGGVVSAAPVGERPQAALSDMLVRCGLLTRERANELAARCEASAQTFARVAVQSGAVSASEVRDVEDLLTRDTIFEVLRWTDGSFDFRSCPVEHDRRFESLLGAEQILMDGLRMCDEWPTLTELVPSERVVFQRVRAFDDYEPREVEDLASAARVYAFVDGRLTVRRIVDLSRLGTFEATRMIADLRRAQVIEPLRAATGRRRRRRFASAAPRVPISRWIATLAPIAFLFAAVLSFPARERDPLPPDAFPIERAPFESVREAYAARRVRNALEAYRFARGDWPTDLSDLGASGILPEDALAHYAGRPYYYVRREDGAVFLPPER